MRLYLPLFCRGIKSGDIKFVQLIFNQMQCVVVHSFLFLVNCFAFAILSTNQIDHFLPLFRGSSKGAIAAASISFAATRRLRDSYSGEE